GAKTFIIRNPLALRRNRIAGDLLADVSKRNRPRRIRADPNRRIFRLEIRGLRAEHRRRKSKQLVFKMSRSLANCRRVRGRTHTAARRNRKKKSRIADLRFYAMKRTTEFLRRHDREHGARAGSDILGADPNLDDAVAIRDHLRLRTRHTDRVPLGGGDSDPALPISRRFAERALLRPSESARPD